MKKVQVFRDDDGNFWCEGKPIKGLPHLYTKVELAEYFGVTVYAVEYWIKKRKIDYIKVEGQVRFTHQSLLDLLEDRTVRAWGRELPSDSPLAKQVS